MSYLHMKIYIYLNIRNLLVTIVDSSSKIIGLNVNRISYNHRDVASRKGNNFTSDGKNLKIGMHHDHPSQWKHS